MGNNNDGNGSTNGNGKSESKSLAELAVQRRQEVRRDKKQLPLAKLLFDDLTDLCFLSRFSVGFGVVRIGKPFLAQRLGCSVATITRAQLALTPSELWTRTGWYEGHEITIWFLRGIADNQLEFDQFTEGAMLAPRTKVAPRVASLRNGHGHFRSVEQNQAPSPVKVEAPPPLLEKKQAPPPVTVHPGHLRRGATVTGDGATPSPVTGVNRHPRPSGPVTGDGGPRSPVTGPPRQIHRAGPVTGDGGTPSPVTVYKDKDRRMGDRKEGSPPSGGIGEGNKEDVELAAWRQSLNGSFPSRLEKLRSRLIVQREAATAPNVRAFIGRKVKILNEVLDGPTPAPHKPGPARALKPAARMPTEAELLEGGRYALSVNKPHLITPAQRAAMQRAGELK